MPRSIDIADAKRQFTEALRSRHLVPSRSLVDGKDRCDATNKGTHGREDGVYVLHLDGWPAGAFINYTDGLGWTKWKYQNSVKISAAERKRLFDETRKQQAEAHYQRAKTMRSVARHARQTWEASEPAKNNNPGSDPLHVHLYLTRKDIRAHGVRTFENSLVVPMYSPDKQIVNLQFIDAGSGERSKRFIEGGRVAGCYYFIKRRPADHDDDRTVCVCEGFATGATIQESTGYGTYVAFNSGNLLAVALMVRERHSDARIIICADDDWKNIPNAGIDKARKAARAIGALLAVPSFPLMRAKGDTDFNDMAKAKGHKAVRHAIENASEPEDDEEEDAPMDKDERNRLIDELVKITDRIDYALERKKVAKDIGIPVAVLDQEVKRLRAKAKGADKDEPPLDIDALRESAQEIIDCDDVLELFIKHSNRTIAGEVITRKMILLSGVSRLLDDKEGGMHLAIKGPSSSGKSKVRERVLAYFPPESIISFLMLSDKALFYTPDDLSHKILSMGEAFAPDEQRLQDMILRQLMSEGEITYEVVQKQDDGTHQTVKITKKGPVVFMVTTTRNKLHPENETRMLSLEVDESAEQTREVLRKISWVKGLNRQPKPANFNKWHNYQRWLAAGNCKVSVPFAPELGELIEGTKSVRLRRDYGQFISGIKAHAIMHREHRDEDEDGAIVATIDEDYAVIRKLMGDLLATASEVKTRKAIKETVEAVRDVIDLPHSPGATVRTVGNFMKLDRSAVYRRLRSAEDGGLIVNTEERKGRPARYALTGERPELSSCCPRPAS